MQPSSKRQMFNYISPDGAKLNAAAFGVIALLNLNMVLCKMSTEHYTLQMASRRGLGGCRVEVKIEFILSYISDNEITDDR